MTDEIGETGEDRAGVGGLNKNSGVKTAPDSKRAHVEGEKV